MKIPSFARKRKLEATARRAPQRVADYHDEPSMKLTNAFFVVLVLHVVAVGGIYAFNSLKARRTTAAPRVVAQALQVAETQPKATPTAAAAPVPARMKTHRVRQGETLAKIAAMYGVAASEIEDTNGLKNVGALRVGQDLQVPARSGTGASEDRNKKTDDLVAKNSATGPKDSGQIYAVGKGESPVSIAKKLGVSYDDLLKLNKLDDPKKLQIGTKLHVPVKTKSG